MEELFWQRVKGLLAKKDIKQVDLCNETGINVGTFKGWLNKNRYPDLDAAVKIASYLDTTVEYLVTGLQGSVDKLKDYKMAIYNIKLALENID